MATEQALQEEEAATGATVERAVADARARCEATESQAVSALEKELAAERQAWERELREALEAEEARVRKAVAGVWPAMRAQLEEKEEVRAAV